MGVFRRKSRRGVHTSLPCREIMTQDVKGRNDCRIITVRRVSQKMSSPKIRKMTTGFLVSQDAYSL